MLRTLTKKFNPKVAALEEMEKINTMSLEGLVGILQTYEMNYLEEEMPKSIALNVEESSDDEDDAAYLSRKVAKLLQYRRMRQLQRRNQPNQRRNLPRVQVTYKQPNQNQNYNRQ